MVRSQLGRDKTVMKSNFKNNIDILLELGKVRITAFVAISTSVGYIMASGSLDAGLILPTIGVFLLAVSASALNHYQESDIDGLMNRTKDRPIPSGRITSRNVLYVSILFFILSSTIILLSSNEKAMFIGWVAFVWYNLIYTPLKRKYAFAVVPGSVIGALPPIIGWVAAGGSPYEPQILALALFFFIWQVPHFWLLLLVHGKDYEQAGLPTLTQIFDNSQLSRITFVWIIGLSTSCFLIPLFGVSNSVITYSTLFLLGLWLVYSTGKMLFVYYNQSSFRKAFMQINIYVLAVVVILSIDKLLLTDF